MATTIKPTTKPRARKGTKVPPPGRKVGKKEARKYVFKRFGKAMDLLAKN